MALIERLDLNPDRAVLRTFGFLALAIFTLLGGYIHWTGGLPVADFPESASTVAIVLWIIAAVSGLFSLLIPALNRPLYAVLVVVGYPIGIVVSFLLLGFMFYAVITPIGLVFKVIGHDPLHRRFDARATSYWVRHKPAPNSARYFK